MDLDTDFSLSLRLITGRFTLSACILTHIMVFVAGIKAARTFFYVLAAECVMLMTLFMLRRYRRFWFEYVKDRLIKNIGILN